MCLTKEEEKELKVLRSLQLDFTRYFSQEEFERIGELTEKKFKDSVEFSDVENKMIENE